MTPQTMLRERNGGIEQAMREYLSWEIAWCMRWRATGIRASARREGQCARAWPR